MPVAAFGQFAAGKSSVGIFIAISIPITRGCSKNRNPDRARRLFQARVMRVVTALIVVVFYPGTLGYLLGRRAVGTKTESQLIIMHQTAITHMLRPKISGQTLAGRE